MHGQIFKVYGGEEVAGMKKGDRVLTPHGVGTIVMLEPIYNYFRYGVKHDTWPAEMSETLFPDKLLFYLKKELKKHEGEEGVE